MKIVSIRIDTSELNANHYNIYLLQMVGLGELESPTSPLSGVRSNQLSYRPILKMGDHNTK